MRSTEELNKIALRWAKDTIQDWQYEYSAWDVLAEDEELSDEELEYCQSVKFKVEVK
ncbi:hypothetical protein D3C85_1282990 [compost metagenome]